MYIREEPGKSGILTTPSVPTCVSVGLSAVRMRVLLLDSDSVENARWVDAFFVDAYFEGDLFVPAGVLLDCSLDPHNPWNIEKIGGGNASVVTLDETLSESSGVRFVDTFAFVYRLRLIRLI